MLGLFDPDMPHSDASQNAGWSSDAGITQPYNPESCDQPDAAPAMGFFRQKCDADDELRSPLHSAIRRLAIEME